MPTTATPTAGPILALDLGKYKTVACLYDPAAAAARFETVTTGRPELARRRRRKPPREGGPPEAPGERGGPPHRAAGKKTERPA